MVYILLFLGLNQTPAHLGTYPNLQSCQNAIRVVYQTKMIPRGIDLSVEVQESIRFAVDNRLKYQQEYICQAKE
jgi:hypothetical protein